MRSIRAALSQEGRRRLFAALLIAGVLVGASHVWASIRVDGSQFQSVSAFVTYPKNKTSGAQTTTGTGQAPGMMMTFGQAIMARGKMPDSGGESVAFRIGMGYEYNVWQTAFELGCGCTCHSDPVCDGAYDVLDVVQAINVAFRGEPSDSGETCTNALTDINCDDTTDLLDVIGLVDIAFRQIPAGQIVCAPCAN
jgi:hypothetical protein